MLERALIDGQPHQPVDLLDGMLGLQAARGGQALANGADRQRAAVQHAKRGIAKRVDPLGVKVLFQQIAKHVANSLIREALPDDHKYRRIDIGKQTRWSVRREGTTVRDFATIRHLRQPRNSFQKLPRGSPILLCRAENEETL